MYQKWYIGRSSVKEKSLRYSISSPVILGKNYRSLTIIIQGNFSVASNYTYNDSFEVISYADNLTVYRPTSGIKLFRYF